MDAIQKENIEKKNNKFSFLHGFFPLPKVSSRPTFMLQHFAELDQTLHLEFAICINFDIRALGRAINWFGSLSSPWSCNKGRRMRLSFDCRKQEELFLCRKTNQKNGKEEGASRCACHYIRGRTLQKISVIPQWRFGSLFAEGYSSGFENLEGYLSSQQ